LSESYARIELLSRQIETVGAEKDRQIASLAQERDGLKAELEAHALGR